MVGQRPDVFDFPLGQPHALQIGGVHGKQLGGGGHPLGEALLEPSSNGAGGESRNLLADDRVDQHAERVAHRPRLAPGPGIDGFRRLDEPRDLSIAGFQRGQRRTAT